MQRTLEATPRRVPRSLQRLLTSLAALPVLLLFAGSSSAGTGGPCPASGSCHLPRWVPDEAAAFDALGTAVAFDGDHAALGAPGGGAVYVYERAGATWVQQQRLDALPTSGADFGSALALEGGRLVVGDPSDGALGPDGGAAHLYLELGGMWSYAELLADPDGLAGDRLGTSVAVTDTWAVAGAPGDSLGGRVHLFLESEGWPWWTSVRDFATGTEPEAFGSAVAMHGPWLLVGDPLSDTHAADTGAVLTYEIYEPFAFFEDLTIPAELEAGDGFGGALAFDGERIVVGASGDDELGNDAGAAWVFAFTATEIEGHQVNPVQRLVACGGVAGDGFGTAVGVDGQRIAIGAAGNGTGRVQVFSRDAGAVPEGWSLAVELAPADGSPGDGFASALAIAGDYVLAGSPGADAAGDESGAGYLLSLSSETLAGGECPCNFVATAATLGAGKPGSLGLPELSLDRAPVPGEATTVVLTNALEGAAPVLFFGTIATELPFDAGELYVADPHFAALPIVDAAQSSRRVWDVPPVLGLCGSSVVFQAFFVDPVAAGSLHTAQSNGVVGTVGY